MENGKPTRRKLSDEARTSAVSQGRHEYHCEICSHPKREEIEQAFLTWSRLVHIDTLTMRRFHDEPGWCSSDAEERA